MYTCNEILFYFAKQAPFRGETRNQTTRLYLLLSEADSPSDSEAEAVHPRATVDGRKLNQSNLRIK